MYRLTLLLALLASVPPCAAQTDSTWINEIRGTLSFSQVGFRKWHDGGVNSLSLGAGISGKATKNSAKTLQEYEARLEFGIVKQDGIELRKSEDLIHLVSSIKFSEISLFGQFRPTITIDFRSQFADGFQYNDKDPTINSVKISGFFSPAISTQSLGLNYPFSNWLEARLGVAAKETIVTIRNLRSRYKVNPDQTFRWQIGSSGLVKLERMIFSNVHIKSTLTLFFAFNQYSPDFIWETFINMKVNSWLQVEANYTAYLDRDLSPSIQQKQALAIGVSFRLL
ncbi:MAG: DUF3078 domain-containing protein [Bacteroidetes bacterium]|nr:DUF3078 domain-containing protein [Bacteroidota bacterium]MCY4204360.1 DUF3078 domain-containing protein [Bacteroidota bacterium]